MQSLPRILTIALALLTVSANAAIVTVQVTGEVEFNQISSQPLSSVTSGSPATLTFQVDSNNYVDSPNFPTRGYVIDQSSLSLTFPQTSVGLQNPFPAGETPYFVLRNNDPAVDGFFIANNTDFFSGLPINQSGIFGNFVNEYHVTYDGGTLASLNILDALGTYDYTDLQVFNWSLDDGPFNPMLINFTQMTITPEPASLGLVTVALLAARRRRR